MYHPETVKTRRLDGSYRLLPFVNSHSPICPQPSLGGIEDELFADSTETNTVEPLKHDEFECLNLNITCPGNANPDSRYPVMMWIHGYASSL